MMKSGLTKIRPDSRDYSLLHTYGAVADPSSLPLSFSIYDGRQIPNQNLQDNRFSPALPPLPYGCTGETGAFESGIQDETLYNPQDLYINTPPGDFGGRDIREMLKVLTKRGPKQADGSMGPKRTAYFNCYGAGKIDDFDAARIAIWINQIEKRGVYIGTFWYWGDTPATVLETPSFKMSEASLHCYLATGWAHNDQIGEDELEVIPWVGQDFGTQGRFYITRTIYNALMVQPWTGAFTITKTEGQAGVPIGYQAIIDHLVYFIRNLFQIKPNVTS